MFFSSGGGLLGTTTITPSTNLVISMEGIDSPGGGLVTASSSSNVVGEGGGPYLAEVKPLVCAFCDSTWKVPTSTEADANVNVNVAKGEERKAVELIAKEHFNRVLKSAEVIDLQGHHHPGSITNDVGRCLRILDSVIFCDNCIFRFCKSEEQILKAQMEYLVRMSGKKDFAEMLADPWLDLKRFAYEKLKNDKDSISAKIKHIEGFLAKQNNERIVTVNANLESTISGNPLLTQREKSLTGSNVHGTVEEVFVSPNFSIPADGSGSFAIELPPVRQYAVPSSSGTSTSSRAASPNDQDRGVPQPVPPTIVDQSQINSNSGIESDPLKNKEVSKNPETQQGTGTDGDQGQGKDKDVNSTMNSSSLSLESSSNEKSASDKEDSDSDMDVEDDAKVSNEKGQPNGVASSTKTAGELDGGNTNAKTMSKKSNETPAPTDPIPTLRSQIFNAISSIADKDDDSEDSSDSDEDESDDDVPPVPQKPKPEPVKANPKTRKAPSKVDAEEERLAKRAKLDVILSAPASRSSDTNTNSKSKGPTSHPIVIAKKSAPVPPSPSPSKKSEPVSNKNKKASVTNTPRGNQMNKAKSSKLPASHSRTIESENEETTTATVGKTTKQGKKGSVKVQMNIPVTGFSTPTKSKSEGPKKKLSLGGRVFTEESSGSDSSDDDDE